MKKLILIALISVLSNTLFGQVTAYQQIGTSSYNYYVTNSFRAGVSLITLGQMEIPATTSSSIGVIYKGGTRFISAYKPAGTNDNLFIGLTSGNFTLAATSNFNGNVGIGQNCLQTLSTGYFNTATGGYAGEDLTTGHSNTFNGIQAGRNVSTGNSNTALGDAALFGGTANATTATENTAIGALALNLITTGARNTSLGKSALEILTTGSNNIGIGYQAGNNITTGSNNTVIGYDIDAPSPTGSNQIVIGNANVTYSFPSTVGGAGTFLKDVAGNGVLSWATPSGGTPAGSNFQIQINNSGAFGATGDFTFNTGNDFKAAVGNGGLHFTGDHNYIGDFGAFLDGIVFDIRTDDSHIAYIDNTAHTGLFGINTATPSVAFDVVGAINVNSGTLNNSIGGTGLTTIGEAGGDAYLTVAGSTDANTITYNASNGHNFATGMVTIDDLSGTGTRAVLADASGLLSAPISDITTKENIKEFNDGITTLMKLRPVTFSYRDGFKNYGQGKQIGFIAQDIEKILPNSVYTNNSNGKMGYNENDLIPVLTKALQEQQEQIDELEKRVDKLEKELKKK